MIFYKKLLEVNSLTTSDKIIYSQFVYKSLSSIDEVFDNNGYFDTEALYDAFGCDSELWLDVNSISAGIISKNTGISLRQVKLSLSNLKQLGYISYEDDIYHVCVFKNVVCESYFNIDMSAGELSTHKIFYFYLKHKADKHNGGIDTWKSKLASEYHTTEENIKKMITRLKKDGLIEREDGILKIK